MRVIVWFLVWGLTLFTISIRVQYSDGLQIALIGWWETFFQKGENGNEQGQARDKDL